MQSISLYLHIPFCAQICHYCDFAITRLKVNQGASQMREYTDNLKRELDYRLKSMAPLSVPSIYFGGGTPSLLPPSHLEEILNLLSRWASWDERHLQNQVGG